MKLHQKLAMALAALMLVTTPIVTNAATIAVDRESLTSTSTNHYNKYWYVEKDAEDNDYPMKNNAMNLKIQNNHSEPIEGESYFTIVGTDIKFNDDLFPDTKDKLSSDYQNVDDANKVLENKTYVYALQDVSESNDQDNADFVTSGIKAGDYPHRLFAIEDGQYTSYISISYALYKEYIYSKTDADQFAFTHDNIDEVYVFEKYIDGDHEVYISTDGELALNDTIETSNVDGSVIKPVDNSSNKFAYFGINSQNTASNQVYIKEYTLFIDEDDSSVLDVELYQNFARNQSTGRVYIPIAFQVTGKAPAVKLESRDYRYNGAKANLSSNTEVSGDMIELDVKRKGELSVDGNGKFGVFELGEEQRDIFGGNFVATDDWEDDFVLDEDSGTDNGTTGGLTFHLTIENSELEFDLSEGDRYWDEEPEPENNVSGMEGKLQEDNLISVSGGFSRQEEYIQVEILAVEDNELLMRVIDETGDLGERKYEGAIEFVNFPVTTASRKTELKLEEIELSITQVEDLVYNEGDGDLGDWEFDDANELDEKVVIAEVVDDDVMLEAIEEVELIAGQDEDEVEVALKALVGQSIDIRDEFYITISNGSIVSDAYDVEFEYEGGSIYSSDEHQFFYEDEDDDEWILDLDELAEALEIDPDDSAQEDEWYEILSELTFKMDVKADANTSGDIKLNIESDNLKNDEVSLVIGTVTNSFSYDAPKVTLDLGVKEQQIGKIVIEEADEELFHDDREIILGLEDLVINDASVSTDEDESELGVDYDIKDGLIIITVTDESDGMGGTITIEDIEFDVWAGTPRGTYDLYIGGNALDHGKDSYDDFSDGKDEDDVMEEFADDHTVATVSEYLEIGDGASSKEQLVTIVDFRAGTTTVNGVRVSMTSKPYITPNGWSMIGVRDIATFFGIAEEQIAYGHDENNVMTVTITNGKIGASGSTLVTVKNGSKILTVNGTPVIMGEPMTIGSDNRAYAPIRPIAEALGLSVDWNGALSRATFTN
ncbi:hypothetical protein AN641_06160 [Candidatus Epulonipiscioides gigas]|nr:hypothetical protein AN641_06160 [Epulopiscium sp. SCG-C07WGA-EpuloA2]